MAFRSPTSPTQWTRLARLTRGKPILAAEVDEVCNDLEFMLNARELLISDVFWPYPRSNTAYAEIRRWLLDATDTCSAAVGGEDVVETEAYALAWCDAGTTGEVKLSTLVLPEFNGIGTVTATVPTWHLLEGPSPGDCVTAVSLGIEETFVLSSKRTSGTHKIYTAGLIVVSHNFL